MKYSEEIAQKYLETTYVDQPIFEPNGHSTFPDFQINNTAFEVSEIRENKNDILHSIESLIIKIDEIIKSLEEQNIKVSKETLSHISLLPFKHVLPNGTYFIETE